MKYTTKENIEKHLGETITENIDLYIDSACRYIDDYTQREFQSGDEEIRYYDGNGKQELIIDPATEVSKVEYSLDGITWIEIANDRWETAPYNKLPIRRIMLKWDVFYLIKRSVRITGKFGWSECPPKDIVFCATVLASAMYKGKSSSEISSERIGDYWVNFESEQGIGDLDSIKKILNIYRKI